MLDKWAEWFKWSREEVVQWGQAIQGKYSRENRYSSHASLSWGKWSKWFREEVVQWRQVIQGK